jgi:glycine/D-amino acid oxidase-like deaminating enzyme
VPAVGQKNAALAADAYAAGAARIAAVQARYGIACDFVHMDGYLIGTPGDEVALSAEKTAATEAGLRGVEWLRHSPVPGDPTVIGLVFPGQARLHPLKYLNGLARAFREGGGVIRQALVTAVAGDGAAKTEKGFTLRATRALVLANNAQGRFHVKPRPQELFTSYTIAAEIPAGAAPDAVMWDLEDPYHYVRLQPTDGKMLILIGGEDHKAHQPVDADARFARLAAWGRAMFPALGDIVARWAGSAILSRDARTRGRRSSIRGDRRSRGSPGPRGLQGPHQFLRVRQDVQQ